MLPRLRRGQVRWRMAGVFGVAGIGAAFAGLSALLGAAAVTALAAGRLPERVLRYGFAGLMLAVGVFVAAQPALGHAPAPS